MPVLIHTLCQNVTQSKDANKSSCMHNLQNESIFHEEQHEQGRLVAVAGALTAKDGAGPPFSKGNSVYKGYNDNDTTYSMNVIANAAALAAAIKAKVGGQGGEGDHRQLSVTAALASLALPHEQKLMLDVMMCHVASSLGNNPVAPPSTELKEKEVAQKVEMETEIKDANEDVANAGVVAANSTADTTTTNRTATDDNAVVDCALPMMSGFASVSQSSGKEHSEKCEPPSPFLK
jgi:hypothetical protein